MSETCARCDTNPAPYGITPPFEWIDYLREERGLEPPIGTLTIHLCHDCSGKADVVKETWREFGSPALDTESGVASNVRGFLDALDTDAITDDML